MPATRTALNLGGDELELELGVGHVLIVADQCPAKRQRFGNDLAKRPDFDPDDIDVAAVGIRFDRPGDRLAQRQLMHGRSPPSPRNHAEGAGS